MKIALIGLVFIFGVTFGQTFINLQDLFNMQGQGGGGGGQAQPQKIKKKEFDKRATYTVLDVDLEEIYNGALIDAVLVRRGQCTRCKGSGYTYFGNFFF
jgi:DnaJ-class molecular chaperone